MAHGFQIADVDLVQDEEDLIRKVRLARNMMRWRRKNNMMITSLRSRKTNCPWGHKPMSDKADDVCLKFVEIFLLYQ